MGRGPVLEQRRPAVPALTPVELGYVVRDTGNRNLTFYLTAALYFVGATCWLFINSTKPLPQDYGE